MLVVGELIQAFIREFCIIAFGNRWRKKAALDFSFHYQIKKKKSDSRFSPTRSKARLAAILKDNETDTKGRNGSCCAVKRSTIHK